mmetsp:Transcript_10916/g.13855  ORF Transcript_10916/g.13855 Transcript_10916/m.13855 type:complete len:80 (+) Transcript_10916:323-562(+)
MCIIENICPEDVEGGTFLLSQEIMNRKFSTTVYARAVDMRLGLWHKDEEGTTHANHSCMLFRRIATYLLPGRFDYIYIC